MKNKEYTSVAVWLFVLTIAELFVYPKGDLSLLRNGLLLSLMATKALLVALAYMNLRKEGWALKVAFFAPIPVALYFLFFLLYDAAYVWKS